ncbi:hypothetical protein CIB84_010693 [Bambusicola thoracicus]|uniref:Uncharacterized protein n=1 Tax=Bambusicola thoracicus TaxID=9083 RepID=A0A2P4SN57_BAMTH|nr:hypothetical protein CIB84_010693 [Bambusicola thoracicus]
MPSAGWPPGTPGPVASPRGRSPRAPSLLWAPC